jgi:hypothetical protein
MTYQRRAERCGFGSWSARAESRRRAAGVFPRWGRAGIQRLGLRPRSGSLEAGEHDHPGRGGHASFTERRPGLILVTPGNLSQYATGCVIRAGQCLVRVRRVRQQLAVHRAIMVVDVERFGDPARTNLNQLAIREALYKALTEAFAESGIGWDSCVSEDRGDGALILIPPEVPKTRLVAGLTRARPHPCTGSSRRPSRSRPRRAHGAGLSSRTWRELNTLAPSSAPSDTLLGARPSLTCAPTATRTRDLLLRRHLRSVARRCQMWPDVPFRCSDNGWTWPGAALCLWSLAPRLAPRDLVSNANVRIPGPSAAAESPDLI